MREPNHLSSMERGGSESAQKQIPWLEIIRKLRSEGKTQKEIAEILGWSREKVAHHVRLLDKVVTEVLDFCKSRQNGRVTEDVTTVTFNFTERWFRESGIYNLPGERQMELMRWFVEEKS